MPFRRLFGRSGQSHDDAAHALYSALVGQARRPEFYLACGVADTVDGRFDMMALHAWLVMRRLGAEGAAGLVLSQAVFDIMFADMDQNLREMGVGDLSVGKRVKDMARAFYGRISAYDGGLAGATGELEDALVRNLYRNSPPQAPQVAAMAAYLRREATALAGQDFAALAAGRVEFGAPVAP